MRRLQPAVSFVAVLAWVGLSGCAPMRFSYQHIEIPDARYFKSICYASTGPPSVAYYPFHGIYISLDISYTVALGLHVPAGTTVNLNGNTVHIIGSADTGPVDTIIPIRAVRHGSLGNGDPAEFSGMRDPFTSADNFGPLTGDTYKGRYLWYLFISETSETAPHTIRTPRKLIRGTVELPSISINGQSYDAQSLPFEHRTHSELAPVNC